MKRNIENRNLSHEEFDTLKQLGLAGEGEIDGIGEVEKVVITDGINNNRREIITRPQVVFSGIGKTRKAVTVFVPDRQIMDELKRS